MIYRERENMICWNIIIASIVNNKPLNPNADEHRTSSNLPIFLLNCNKKNEDAIHKST